MKASFMGLTKKISGKPAYTSSQITEMFNVNKGNKNDFSVERARQKNYKKLLKEFSIISKRLERIAEKD